MVQKSEKGQNSWLLGSKAKKVSLHVNLRYVREEDNRWHLHIVVDDSTNPEEWRDAWKSIVDAREYLKSWQGTDPNQYSVAILLDLEQQIKVWGPAKLAQDMNFEALVYLLWAMDKRRGKENANMGQILFINHFRGLGIKEKDAKELEVHGKAELSNGELPWTLKKGPIGPRRITDALRQFAIEKKSKKVVIKPATTINHLIDFRFTAFEYGYWEKVGNLLKGAVPPKEYSSFEKRLYARENELIMRIVEFPGRISQ